MRGFLADMAVRVDWTAPNSTLRKVVRNLSSYIRPKSGRQFFYSGKDHDEDGYRVYLIHTLTGQVGAQLSPESGSWEIPLNGTESFSVKVPLSELEGIAGSWYSELWGGLLITWSYKGKETPWLAGPITARPLITQDFLELEAKGVRELYSRLVVGTDIRPRNESLGHIMWLLADAIHIKPGMSEFPIYDATPDPGGKGHSRNYFAWNLQNNGLDKRMQELSAVANGPDVMFRPVWADEGHTSIKWGVHHGTSLSRHIYSPSLHLFDTTAPFSAIQDVEVRSDSSNLVSRVWASGSGEGAGTAIARVEDWSLVKAGFPFTETVLSDTSVGEDDDSVERDTKKLRKFPVALTVGPGGSDGPRYGTVRYPLMLGPKVKRWRLHVENRNPSSGTTGAPRETPVKMSSLWVGSNDWSGAMRGGKNVGRMRNITAGNSESVSPWISNKQIGGNKELLLSFDYEATKAPYQMIGGGWHATKRVAGTSGNANSFTRRKYMPFHVWIEVEVDGKINSVAIFGSSSSAGSVASTPVYDSPLNQYTRRINAVPVHYSESGGTLAGWSSGSSYKWNQWEKLSRSDAVIFYMGHNDVFGGASLATMQSRFNTVLPLVKDRIARSVYYATIPPRNNATGSTETTRRAYNKWLHTIKDEAMGSDNRVFDFAASVSKNDETLIPEYSADGTHLTTAGYGANSRRINVNFEAEAQAREELTTSQLRDMAKGEMNRRKDGVDQFTFKVSAFDETHGLGRWFVGDLARVKMEGWLTIPDGLHNTRIIHASGDLSELVTLDFQEGVYL